MSPNLAAPRSLVLAAVGALFVAVAFIIGTRAPAAEAHGVQVSSSPAANAELAEAPDSISVTFSEPIEPSVTTIQLWDTSPAEIPLGAVSFPTDDTISTSISEELPSGVYTVIWRNLSTVDGHTWAGSYTFIVLGPNGEVPQGTVPASLQDLAEAPANRPSTLDTTARWIVLLGSAVMLGGTAYVMFVVLPSTRAVSAETSAALRKLSLNVLVVSAAIAVFLVLQGSLIQLLDQADKLGGLGKTDELLTDTRFGNYLIARQGLLLVALFSIGVVWRSGKALALPLTALLVASFGVLFTQSMVSHAAGADGAFWKISADLLHLVAASLWVGGLIHIGMAMPRWLDELTQASRTLFAAESFRRFSVLAAFSVLVIMVSGVLSALAQFTSFEQLFDTTYGWSLVGKLGAMLPLLAVGGLNAFILQPRVVRAGMQVQGAAGDDTSATGALADLQRLLANTVRIEAVLGIAVLVAVGVLTQLEPPRAEAEAEAAAAQQPPSQVTNDSIDERGYFLEAAQVGGLVVSLKVDPARVGVNTFEVGLGSEFGNVGEVLLVRLVFDHEDPAIGQSQLDLPLSGSAKFAAEGSNLSLPGNWDVTATIRRRGEEDVQNDYTIPVRQPGDTGEGPEADAADESSIWDWPFEDRRSLGAIIALAVGGVGLVAVGVWQARNLRRRV
jgi:copper transport protein